MRMSNMLFKQEQEAAELAHRLALENNALLDLLWDANNCPQLPASQRIDVTTDSSLPNTSLLRPLPPPYPSPPSPSESKEHVTLGEEAYNKLLTDLKQAEESKKAGRAPPTKSLASLMATVPHKPFQVTDTPPTVYDLPSVTKEMARDLDFSLGPEKPEPVAYISPDKLDEYLTAYDAEVGFTSPLPTLNSLNSDCQPGSKHLSDKDLEVKNPNSVYNWLRIHEPKIFLQDGEPPGLMEAAAKRPGVLRGAGKRAAPKDKHPSGPAEAPKDEFVDEEGLAYDTSLGVPIAKEKPGKESSAAKRKRLSEDDAGYRPKGGSSRPTKKKKGESKSKKGKGKAVASEEAPADVEMVLAEED
jgi:hypothetical protein